MLQVERARTEARTGFEDVFDAEEQGLREDGFGDLGLHALCVGQRKKSKVSLGRIALRQELVPVPDSKDA